MRTIVFFEMIIITVIKILINNNIPNDYNNNTNYNYNNNKIVYIYIISSLSQ